ncbi:MAG: DUF5615 family PIN-like protein [Candidatus Anammoxibacter sp.]
MDFLANENFPLYSIKLLRNVGHNVVSIIEETPGAKDPNILNRATKEDLVILTFDRDYGELIYRYKFFDPPAIVYFRFDPKTPEEPAKILLSFLKQKDISIRGKFTVIEHNRVRQKLLPTN